MMVKVNELLASRFKKGPKALSKMTNLAELSSQGNLSSFSGVFRVTPLTENESDALRHLLMEYNVHVEDISKDLDYLSAITSEVKAINNQAAILHGERIKKAQEILKKYREGAFSIWLINTYGNRQTPYNFLQYFEFYSRLDKELQHKVEAMPRQVIYTLATRNCPQEYKEEMVKTYKGQTKKELLNLIRVRFPLGLRDKRAPNLTNRLLEQLKKIQIQFESHNFSPSDYQKQQLTKVLQSLQKLL